MPNSLKKIIDLVKKNKERVVFFDNSDFNDGIVVMTLEEYENMKKNGNNIKTEALTKNKIIDSINNDIAVLIEEDRDKKEKIAELVYGDYHIDDDCEVDDDLDEYENLYYYNDDESFTHFNMNSENSGDEEKKGWNIPVDIKEGAE